MSTGCISCTEKTFIGVTPLELCTLSTIQELGLAPNLVRSSVTGPSGSTGFVLTVTAPVTDRSIICSTGSTGSSCMIGLTGVQILAIDFPRLENSLQYFGNQLPTGSLQG